MVASPAYLAALDGAGVGDFFDSDAAAARYLTRFCEQYEARGDAFIEAAFYRSPATPDQVVIATAGSCPGHRGPPVTVPPPVRVVYPDLGDDPVMFAGPYWAFDPDGVPAAMATLAANLASGGCDALRDSYDYYRATLARTEQDADEVSAYARYALDIGREAECDWATQTP